MTDPVNTLQAQLRADLKAAMLGRKSDEIATLRLMLAVIDNAQAVPGEEPGRGQEQRKFGDSSGEVPRRSLSIGELNMLFQQEIASRRTASEDYRAAGHSDRASLISKEAEIISRYVG